MRERQELAGWQTRLGQLQRGRGAGFLAAMAAPEVARDEVLLCVCADPRIDTQCEQRARCYAELVSALGVPLDPIVQSLSGPDWQLGHEVLAALWLRGHPATRDLLASKRVRAAVLKGVASCLPMEFGPAIAELPPRLVAIRARREREGWYVPLSARATPTIDTSLSVSRLFDGARGRSGLAKRSIQEELCRRDAESDRATLADHAQQDPDLAVRHMAARALGVLGDTRLLPCALAMMHDVFTNVERGRRVGMLGYLLGLPAAVTLPIAREWKEREDFGGYFAARVLANHAEPCDREWLEQRIAAGFLEGAGDSIISELKALAHIGDPASAPLLVGIAEQARYSWARRCAMLGLARMPDAPGAAALLREGLWDCEEDVAAVACQSMPAADATASERVRSLATDVVVEPPLRAAAEARLARG